MENINNPIEPNNLGLSEIPEEKLKKIKLKIPEIRENISRFMKHFNTMKEKYPQDFEEIEKRYPHLMTIILKIEKILDKLSSKNGEISDESIYNLVLSYNFYAKEINLIFKKANYKKNEEA